MTKKALDLLEANPASDANGYFLQVEGASIDKQDHAATLAARSVKPTISISHRLRHEDVDPDQHPS